ncbi:hypothetical protein TNCV_415601 [Trichonephila clavipes]|nr:hypothetical protein TNCV_415601 [Trichonephila clavipes]
MLEKVIENWTSRLDYIRASRGSPMPEIIFKIVNNERNSSFESKPTVVQDISDTSTDESISNPVRNKRTRLLSRSDE